MAKLLQLGLYCKNGEELEAFADRVDEYNKKKGFIAVEMEGQESDADDFYDKPHWKIRLEFQSRGYAKDFWTDPDHQRNVVV